MSAQLIQQHMRDLKGIQSEIDRLKNELKVLTKKKKDLEVHIKDYLYQNDQPGIKYQDLVVLAQEKKKRNRKSKDERNQDIEEILQNYGVRNVSDVMNEIADALKGKETTDFVLKIKNGNKNNSSL